MRDAEYRRALETAAKLGADIEWDCYKHGQWLPWKAAFGFKWAYCDYRVKPEAPMYDPTQLAVEVETPFDGGPQARRIISPSIPREDELCGLCGLPKNWAGHEKRFGGTGGFQVWVCKNPPKGATSAKAREWIIQECGGIQIAKGWKLERDEQVSVREVLE